MLIKGSAREDPLQADDKLTRCCPVSHIYQGQISVLKHAKLIFPSNSRSLCKNYRIEVFGSQ